MNPDLVLAVIALVCFALATINVNARGINLVALGLAAWVATLII